jgi:hypothetical protein
MKRSNSMRPAQRRAAAEHEPQRRSVDAGDRGQGFDDVNILFDEGEARQPEKVRDLD